MTDRTAPTQVGSPSDWTALDAGAYFTCGLHGHAAWCWGDNALGELGDRTDQNRLSPVPVDSTASWRSLAAGDEWTCGIRQDRVAECWGGAAYGEQPTAIPGVENWKTLDLGAGHACGLRTDRTAWCFGGNGEGELGDGSTDDSASPVPVG
jgi:alpha-tubulin suppressor-like RCC1 family protein